MDTATNEVNSDNNNQKLNLSLGLGRAYYGEDLVKKFLEVFGREPNENEYWGDWYECDFTRAGHFKIQDPCQLNDTFPPTDSYPDTEDFLEKTCWPTKKLLEEMAKGCA